jgi:uncharacterized protein
MDTLRLLVTGVPGAGKTSFVRTISDIEVVETERTATDETSKLKKTTTVAFDFGHTTIGSVLQLHVYGTPGQTRFDFMWDILVQRAHAYIVLVAAHRPEDFPKVKKVIEFMNSRVQIPMIIGITHLDCPEALSIAEVISQLGYVDSDRPIAVAVDATNQTSVNAAAYLSLLSLLLSRGATRSLLSPPRVRPARPPVVEPPLYVTRPMSVVTPTERRSRW